MTLNELFQVLLDCCSQTNSSDHSLWRHNNTIGPLENRKFVRFCEGWNKERQAGNGFSYTKYSCF